MSEQPQEPPTDDPNEDAEQPEPEPDEDAELGEPGEDAEPEEPEDRCEAVTQMGRTDYRCSLTEGHEGQHAFQPVGDDQPELPMFDPKKLDNENARHERALEKLYGPDWEAVSLCPLCVGVGFMVPLPHGDMPPEQFDAVLAFAGQMQTPELQDDQSYNVCGNCGGWGQTLIAESKRLGLSKQCDDCLGLGYIKSTNVTVLPPFVAMIPDPQHAAPVAVQSYGAPGPNDQWGRPTGHAHYGIEPAAVT